MFRQRHALFVERKGWRELRRADGRDIDAYDGMKPFTSSSCCWKMFASARLNPWSHQRARLDSVKHAASVPDPRPQVFASDWW
jgi:hypothetical protein